MIVPLRILMLEDRPADAELILIELRRAGYDPRGPCVDKEADFLAALDPALEVILADYTMPQFSATRALELVRQRGLEVPVIVVSGTVGEDVAVSLIKLGATDYIMKDRLRRLGTAVQQALAQRRQNDAQKRLTRLEHNISLALTSDEDLHRTLAQCSKALVRDLDVAVARIWTADDAGSMLTLAARAGADTAQDAQLQHLPCGTHLIGQIAAGRKPVVINHGQGVEQADADQNRWGMVEGLPAFAGFPLLIQQRLVGVMAVLGREPFSDPALITAGAIAGQLALVIQHKRAQEALAESEQRFRQMAENIQEVFWLSDPANTKMFYVSPAYETVWGRSCQSLYDNPKAFIEAVHPADRPGLEAALKHKTVEGKFEAAYRILRPDGTERWIQDRGFPIRDAEGRIYRSAGLAEDVTQRKTLEQQLVRSQKMEAMGQLAGGVAHDFNNLLLVITLASDMMLETISGVDPNRAYIEEILNASARAAQLTRQLLAFSHRQILEMRVLDLRVVIAGTNSLLRRLIGANIELISLNAPELACIRADPGQVEQVIMNLAINARDAMPNGGTLTLETANTIVGTNGALPAQAGVPPGAYVTLTVRDTGIGMTPDVKSRLFEPFFTTKAFGKGSGLGLATCFGIVRQSGGYITVESAPSMGATFRIYFPSKGDMPAAPAAPAKSVKQLSGTETILLVEDEESARRLSAKALRQQGYQVLEAGNGEAGLSRAREHDKSIDLLVTDIIMPQLGGLALAEQLLTIYPRSRTLYCSGYLNVAATNQGIFHSGVAILQKPFSPGELLRRVREVLDAEVV